MFWLIEIHAINNCLLSAIELAQNILTQLIKVLKTQIKFGRRKLGNFFLKWKCEINFLKPENFHTLKHLVDIVNNFFLSTARQ
jgi:hypothetical protein